MFHASTVYSFIWVVFAAIVSARHVLQCCITQVKQKNALPTCYVCSIQKQRLLEHTNILYLERWCNEAISPVTLTLSMICINLMFTLIKEITTSRIAYNYTHIHIFTNCSCKCFCLLVHLYCTILYCHPLYLSSEVQLSCMFVSFTCPSPLCFLPLSSLVSL